MELPTKKTICLNMIVKDESHVIVETLHNLWSYIPFDTYVVSDTGSSDSTKDLIKAFFDEKGVTGTITDDAWLNFGHNRTVAFNHAYDKSDYVFVWDADDRIKGDFKLPSPLTADSYSFSFGSYSRRQLFNNRKHWKYVGVLHECPTCCEQEGREEKVTGSYHFESNRTGARNKDPLKYLKDGQILEKAFYEALEAKDSIHMRYAYYCANSYNSTSTHKDKAIEFYKKVLTLENWHQEKYNSCIELFTIHDQQGKTQEALHWLVESHRYDKTRIEGIFRLIRHYCSNQPEVAFAYYTLIQDYVENKYLTDNIAIKLFVKNSEYEFYLPYFMIIVSDKAKRKEVGAKMFEILFQKAHVPGEWWSRNVFTNIQFFVDYLPKSPEFFLSMTNYFDACKKAGHTFTPEHHKIIDLVLAKAKPVLGGLEQLSCSNIPSLKDPKKNKIRVMFSITTCKRLDLFQKTIASILRCWTDLDQIDYFYCVDDNSSEEDRVIMRESFPFFDFLMKGPEQRGHMKSMNLIWNRLQEVKPTYWIHMEDDWLFFKQEAYVGRAIKVLESYKAENVHQVVFNKNYGLMMADMDRTGGRMLDGTTRLHIKIDEQPGRHAGFWPHYSLQPSMSRTETILSLGDYTAPNKFFERDYANKYFAKGFQTAFFEGIYSLHIGKQHWETEGLNAYALNAESQFNWQNSVAKQQSDQNSVAKKEEEEIKKDESLSNTIVEQKESEQQKQQSQTWLPITYPKFHGTMADHLEQLKGLIVQNIPFALIRPSDGEYSVIKGQTLTNCDKWTFQAGGQLQTDLLQAVQTNTSGLYVGIPCNTCNKPWNCTQTIYNDYRDLIKTQNITYANLFMNANWPAFISMLKEDKRPLYVVTSGSTGTTELSIRGRHLIDPFLVNQWDTEGLKETEKILDFVKSKNNALICFSAGPLSKVWIPKCWSLNPTNTYLDVGATLDPFTKGPDVRSRFYTDRGHPFAKEACLFRERQLVNPESLPKKSLVYMCVFHNKNYLQLLELLLASMKLFSRTDAFDVLVMTSPEFEKEVQRMSEMVQIPVKTHICDFKTFLESASARLYIYDYPEIDSYGKILYIDTDIVVQNDLCALLTEPLEEKVYALPEGTIEHEYHGGWYFDFKTINKNLPGLNSGILLFPNVPTIRKLFQECSAHIKREQQSGKPMPACLDQPFLNYHFVKGNHYDVSLMTKYALIYCEYPPPPPSQPTSVALCHFVWPVGNAPHKLNRMRKHVTHLLNKYSVLYPSTYTPESKKIVKASYSWSTYGYIFFDTATRFITYWASNNYTWLSSHTIEADWHGCDHILQFSPTFDSFLSIRKGDCAIARHTRHIQEDPFLSVTYPTVSSYELTNLDAKKHLLYMGTFLKEEYLAMLRLLLQTIIQYTNLEGIDILIITSHERKEAIQTIANDLNISLRTMIVENVIVARDASIAKLNIFDYEHIDDYGKILYLDTDMLTQKDLSLIFKLPIENRTYFAPEGTIEDDFHGSWFFDLTQMDRTMAGMNGGGFLFPNTPEIKTLFQICRDHIALHKKHSFPQPECFEQPYLNYHFIDSGYYNLTVLSEYIQLSLNNPTIKPNTSIIHFAGNQEAVQNKVIRMKDYIESFLQESTTRVPGKYLVYACVFYNKDYTELLRLLIASTKFYSSLEGITFLILTSKEIEPLIQDLAKSYEFPILTKTFDYTTIFQAACARLSIFDYEDIGSYEKILYLDTDILIKGSLTTLFDLPLENKLYGLESGSTDSINFGVQFFHPPIKTSGINSGTLLFPNSPIIQRLFQRIRSHVETYTKSGSAPPYSLDQPFINYHAIKDGLYDNQILKPYVALFEGEEVNESTAIVCHFSYPIGNFGHKCNRMKAYLNKCLNHFTIEDKLAIQDHLVKKRFSWGVGFIEFEEKNVLKTTWGKGTYEYITQNTICVEWNRHFHIIQIKEDRLFGLRIWPNDFVACIGQDITPVALITNPNPIKMLTIILSCLKHKHLWPSISERLNENTLILCGGAEETKLVGNILYVNCIDTYDGLSEKMMKAYEFIVTSEQFTGFTHILKADDHDTYFTLQQVKDIETVHRDVLNTQDYVGQQLFKTDQTSGRVHHFGKVPKTSPWYNVPLIEPFVPFLGGGEIYILSKKSLKVIVSDKLRYIKNCYEDRMIGSILHDHDIHPYQLDLKIKTWIG